MTHEIRGVYMRGDAWTYDCSCPYAHGAYPSEIAAECAGDEHHKYMLTLEATTTGGRVRKESAPHAIKGIFRYGDSWTYDCTCGIFQGTFETELEARQGAMRHHAAKGLKEPMGMTEAVNHPPHYQTKSGMEAIDVIEAFAADNFVRGTALKYLLRAGKKGPAKVDLEKAIWYIRREIEKGEG